MIQVNTEMTEFTPGVWVDSAKETFHVTLADGERLVVHRTPKGWEHMVCPC